MELTLENWNYLDEGSYAHNIPGNANVILKYNGTSGPYQNKVLRVAKGEKTEDEVPAPIFQSHPPLMWFQGRCLSVFDFQFSPKLANVALQVPSSCFFKPG